MISVGGRGTRGGVYRVRYVGNDGAERVSAALAEKRPLIRCLAAPQPLSSWSRGTWIPLARELGRPALVAAAGNAELPDELRVRAIEIVTELFDPLDATTAATIRHHATAPVRTRAIWSVGTEPLQEDAWTVLSAYLEDRDPLVVRTALEVALRNASSTRTRQILTPLRLHLDAPDRFVRQAAANIVARLAPQERQLLADQIQQDSTRARITFLLASVDGRETLDVRSLEVALQLLSRTSDPNLMLDAIRVAQRAVGDVGGNTLLPPVFDGYANAHDLTAETRSMNQVLEAAFPTGNSLADHELARLIALLAPDSHTLAEQVAQRLTESSHPVEDIHSLIVLSRLPPPSTASRRAHIASALIHLEAKLSARRMHQDLNWDVRVGEVYHQLVHRDPFLPQAVISHLDFGRPGHIIFTEGMAAELRAQAAERVGEFLAKHPELPWTRDVVSLLAASPHPGLRERVREQFDDLALQGAIILALAKSPEDVDRDKFIRGLTLPDIAVVDASIAALQRLPSGEEPAYQFALLHTLRRLGADKREIALRDRVERQLRRNLGQDFGYQPGRAAPDSQTAAVNSWTDYLNQRFPDVAAQYLRSEQEELARLTVTLSRVDWNQGEAGRGQALFQKHSCNGCHSTRTAIGPDLAGITRRFARDDVFTALLFPNRDVSPRYNTTLIETTRGKVISGLVIYESVDGLTLRDSSNQTIRVSSDEIDARHELSSSLMPTGLLDKLDARDLADLYAYLQSL